MDFKIFRRKFLLTNNIHKSTDEGSSNNEEPVSTNQILVDFDLLTNADGSSTHVLRPENANPDPFSVSETVVNIETPKTHV